MTRNVLATDNQMDELRIGVIRAFDKLRGRLLKDEAQSWIGNSTTLDRWMEGLLPSGGVPHTSDLLKRVIDFSVPCKLPFNGAERVKPVKPGISELEKRGGDLCLDGVKLDLFRSENQKGGKVIGGHDLRTELEAKGGNLSAKILDECVETPALWPENWEKDDQGNTIYVYFWEDIFRNPTNGDLYVRFGYWHGGRVVSLYNWLGNDWDGINPAASRRQLLAQVKYCT